MDHRILNQFLLPLTMSERAYISINDNRDHFMVGDIVAGNASAVLSNELPLEQIAVSFHCIGETNWVEQPDTPYYCDGLVYADQVECHKEITMYSENGEWLWVTYLGD